MADTNDAAAGSSEPVAIPTLEHKAGGEGPISLRDAANSLVDWRRKAASEQPDKQVEIAPEASPAIESGVEPDAAPPQEATGETEGEIDPAETLPPLELPRSWTKEQAAHWNALPRETQEYLIERASKDSAEVRRVQNEAAEVRKAIEVERQRTEQTRLQYEQALPVLLEHLQSAQGKFADIKSMDDVTRLATDDPLRFTEWQAHQMKLGAVQQEMAAAQQRQMEESQNQLRAFMQNESQKLMEKVPELADKEAFKKVSDNAVEVLQDLGFSRDELGKLWSGEAGISLHDHRLQMLLLDGMKYRESKKQQQVAQKTLPEKLKSVPPVQRPGVVQGKGAAQAALVKDLQQQLNTATGTKALRIAAQLRATQQQSGR